MITAGIPQWKFENWLYGSYDQDKYLQFQMLYHIPGVRDYMDYLLDTRSDQEYLARYGLDYSDIHDPRKLSATSSASRMYGTAYRMVSKNINKLYR